MAMLHMGRLLSLSFKMCKITLGLDAAKITDYIEKLFKQKLFKIKFPTKNSEGAHVYLPQEWS